MKTDVAKVCAPFLAELGFKKRAGGVFTVELDDGVLGWLGLNQATRHRAPGEVEVNPVVGVRHQAVEALVAECRGEKPHAYLPPTVSTPLGYVLPEGRYRAWIFGSDAGAAGDDEAARDLAAAIDQHGLAFMRGARTLPQLLERMRDGAGHAHQLAYRRPAALLVAGEPAQAGAELDTELDDLGTRDDAAATDFRRFAAALRSRIDAEAS